MRYQQILGLFVTFSCHFYGYGQTANAIDELRVPTWSVGDAWSVRTRYRVHVDENDSDQNPQAGWVFQIAAEETVARELCFRLEVRESPEAVERMTASKIDALSKEAPTIVMWLRKPTLALVRIQLQIRANGKARILTETFDHTSGVASPVIPATSLIPLAMPRFASANNKRPSDTAKSKTPAVYSFRAKTGQPNMKSGFQFVGFDYQVSQEVQSARSRAKNGSEVIAVDSTKVVLRAGDVVIHQLWSKGQPWPSYSRQGPVESHLVEVFLTSKP